MSESVLPMFSSRSFIVSCPIFRFLSHSEFSLEFTVREYSNYVDLHAAFPIPLAEEIIFHTVCSCLLHHRLINPRYMGFIYNKQGLFWGLCSVPLMHVCFVPIPCCFQYCILQYCLKSGRFVLSALFFFLRIALAILGLLQSSVIFLVSLGRSISL